MPAAALTPADFACRRCKRPLKAPTADGLGPTCRRRINGPSHRVRRSTPAPIQQDEPTMPIPFLEEIPVTRPSMFYRNPETGQHQAAYPGGQWVDLEPEVFWALWHGRVAS